MVSVCKWFVFSYAALILAPALLLSQQATVISRPLSTPGQPYAITVGPDSALWFTDGDNIGRVAATASASDYTGLSDLISPEGITTGADGNLWFTSEVTNLIGRLTPSGVLNSYSVGSAISPQGIAAGPDGALWFTNFMGAKIGRITTDGALTFYGSGIMGAWAITAGPDGAMWFTEYSDYLHSFGNSIGRITTDGVVTEYAITPYPSGLSGITVGSDGALWFTENYSNKVGRITTGGVITEYAIPTPYSMPQGIAAGADGALWFTETSGNQIGRITTGGVITEYPVPAGISNLGGGPEGIAALPDGTIWFANSAANAIGEVVFPTATLSAQPTTVSPGSTITVEGSGFAAGETVDINSNSTGTNLLGSAVSDSTGSFSATVTVPELPNGTNSVVAIGLTSGKLGVAPYVVNLNLAPGQIFADVPPTAYYYSAVNLLSTQNITSGCGINPALYCPAENVTRAEMAIFIVRGIVESDNFTYSSTPYFNDVPATAFGFQWIQKLYELGITAGCGNGDYCPDSVVTRDQMAIFVIRARYGPTMPFDWNPIPYFVDVPSTYYAFSWIQRLYQDGITAGCEASPLTYCPGSPVTRGDMAIFVERGLFNNLLAPGTPWLAFDQFKNFIPPGGMEYVDIQGVNTNFQQGVTQLIFPPNSGITVTSLMVVSATEMEAGLSVASNAPAAVYVSIYEKTGKQEAVSPNAIITEE